MPINLLKQWRVIAQSFRIQWLQIAEYKENFVFDVSSRVIGFLVFWFMWQSILGNTDIPGWDLPGLLVLAGFQNITMSMMLIFIYGVTKIRHMITSGELDNYLARPVVPWVPVVVQNGYFAFSGVLLGLALLVLAWSSFGLQINPFIALTILLLIIVGMGIAFCFALIVASLSFWLGKNDLFDDIFWGIYEFDQYPTTIFPGAIQLILAFTIPFMLLETLTAILLIGRAPEIVGVQWLGAGVLVLIVDAWIANQIWKRGVKKYEAFG